MFDGPWSGLFTSTLFTSTKSKYIRILAPISRNFDFLKGIVFWEILKWPCDCHKVTYFILTHFIGVEACPLAPPWILFSKWNKPSTVAFCFVSMVHQKYSMIRKATANNVITMNITNMWQTVNSRSANVAVDKKSEIPTILRHQIGHKTWNRSYRILMHGNWQSTKKHAQFFNMIWNRIVANQWIYIYIMCQKCKCKEGSKVYCFMIESLWTYK